MAQRLARAEPAVLEAQRSVSNIKQHLTGFAQWVVLSGSQPARSCVLCPATGGQLEDHSRGIIHAGDDFIASIVNFTANEEAEDERETTVTEDAQTTFCQKGRNLLLTNLGRTVPAKPTDRWYPGSAQVGYSEILEQVGPLREEVAELGSSTSNKAGLQAVHLIKKLERKLSPTTRPSMQKPVNSKPSLSD